MRPRVRRLSPHRRALLWRGADEKRGAMETRASFKRLRRRDGGVWKASEEKKVISSTKSGAYNAVHARRRAGAETARSLVYQSPETIFSDITIHFGPIERAASGQASAAPLAAGEGGRRRGACAARPAMHTDRPARRPWVLALRYRTAYQLRQAGQSRTRSQHRHFAG